MKQGGIWLVNLDPTIHSETGKTRPAIILSINEMNEHLPRVLVAPITSNVEKIFLHDVYVPAGTGGLAKDSKIMLDQLRSIDKRRLIKKIGQTTGEILRNACNVAIELISPVQ
jgi:mRNA interferase MazF